MSRPGHAAVLPRSKSTAVIVHPEYHHTLPVEVNPPGSQRVQACGDRAAQSINPSLLLLQPVKLSFWECCDDHVLLNIASRLEDAKALTNLQLVNRRCRCAVIDRASSSRLALAMVAVRLMRPLRTHSCFLFHRHREQEQPQPV
eukprot:GHUV01014678.1.p1 GENE.GHUV01014678.1~~GHUV01014678.1.p1  ORF type:complete len:144 (-),score=28.66 GHUV01014678.1:27-458(-)